MSSKTEIQDSQCANPQGSKPRGIDVAELKAQCLHCDMNPVCHPPSLDMAELESLDQWFPTRRRLQRGETLYDLGEHQQAYWQDYLDRMAQAGASRDPK